MAEHIPYSFDYSGRQVDIEMLQSIARPVNIEEVTLTSVTKTPKIVTGIQKLAQRYTLLLLTPSGTVHFDGSQGSILMTQVLAGTIQSKGRLQNIFASANSSVVQTMREDDRDTATFGTMPADELLQSAQLLNVDVDFATSTLLLQIRIVSEAGESLTFIVPTTAPR